MSKKAQKQICEILNMMQERELLCKYTHQAIPEELQLDTQTDSGFFLGLEHKHDVRDYMGKSSETDGHVLSVGNTGSGKSSIFAKPSCQTWKNPFVALDIKGELSQHYKQLYARKQVNRPYIIFDPMQQIGCYDPYALLDKEDPHFVQYVRELSHAMIPRPIDVREPYWIDMARYLLSAGIIYGFSSGLDFIETMSIIGDVSTESLCKEIMKYGPSEARWFIKEIAALKPEQQAGMGTDVQEWTLTFTIDPYIKKALCPAENANKKSFS